MSVSKRVGAVLCALALLLHLAFFPLRARATVAAGALTAVGFAVTVTAFLNLAGIYPFNPDTGEGLTFPEWTDDALQKLVDLYNVAHATAPITAQTVKSYALGATIAVANEGWNRLRAFVDWIKAEYAPADNVAGVELGAISSGALLSIPFVTSETSYAGAWQNGVDVYRISSWTYPIRVVAQPHSGSTAVPIFACMVLGESNGTAAYYMLLLSKVAARYRVATRSNSNSYSGSNGDLFYNGNVDGYPYYGVQLGISSVADYETNIASNNLPFFDSTLDALRALYGNDKPSLSGITADTATITTPAAPAADSDFTGMQVGGLGQGVTADALEDVIESGVQNREQPTVRQVEVEIQAGTAVDGETGEVTENPVVIDQADVIPSVAALTAPQAFLDALTTTMTTKFPFCLPFDIMRILSAFVKEPRAPVISLTFHDGFSDADYTISVDLAPWDDVAAVVRQLESILLLLGFWMNFDKFNVLNIILGQLG